MSTTVTYRVAFRKTGAGPAQESPTLPTVAAGAEACATGTVGLEKRPLRNVGRTARMLALAYKVEREVEEGRLNNYAEAARRLGITRGRMAHVLALLNLASPIQEATLLGAARLNERRLRCVLREPDWQAQAVLAGTTRV